MVPECAHGRRRTDGFIRAARPRAGGRAYLSHAGVQVPTELSHSERQMVAYALRHPRGRYTAERASQLSGIPKSTIYDWRHDAVLLPDYQGSNPTMWSYRDLVLLRLFAWLRQGGMPRPLASTKVSSVRKQLTRGLDVRLIHATRSDIVLSDGQGGGAFDDDRDNLLPSADFYALLGTFDLLEPIEELRSTRNRSIWAPDLVTPSACSVISPWVLAGDPCVIHSRIPTSAVFALSSERRLPVDAIVGLYPGLTATATIDAIGLERRLRGLDSIEPLAA
jgi:uncharacterized protein (DUF433 family)